MAGDRGADVIDIVPVLRERAASAAGQNRAGRTLSRIIVLPPDRQPSGDGDPRPPAA